MGLYIHSIHSLSPRGNEPQLYNRLGETSRQEPYRRIQEPKYATLLNPAEIRRVAKTVRMGAYCAQQCINEHPTKPVRAILTGTGLGGAECSEKFLCSLLENETGVHSPTPFFQSLPNNVGGQIALGLRCYGYNMTYAHRGASFESALVDTALLLEESTEDSYVLVGGVDELTPYYAESMRQAGYLKTKVEPVEDTQEAGVLLGEGATFALVSAHSGEGYQAHLLEARISYRPSETDFQEEILALLEAHNLKPHDINTLLAGYCGDTRLDQVLRAAHQQLFAHTPTSYFKNDSGEYPTASAFGLQVAVEKIASLSDKDQRFYALVINQYRGVNYSLMLISN